MRAARLQFLAPILGKLAVAEFIEAATRGRCSVFAVSKRKCVGKSVLGSITRMLTFSPLARTWSRMLLVGKMILKNQEFRL